MTDNTDYIEELRALATLVDNDPACETCKWAVEEIERLRRIMKDVQLNPIEYIHDIICSKQTGARRDCGVCKDLPNPINEMSAKIDVLEKITNGLPKDGNGETVIPGYIVHIPFPGSTPRPAIVEYFGEDCGYGLRYCGQDTPSDHIIPVSHGFVSRDEAKKHTREYCNMCHEDTGSKEKICDKCKKMVKEAAEKLVKLASNMPYHFILKAIKKIEDMRKKQEFDK